MGSSGVEMQVLLHNSSNGRSQEEIKTSIYKVPPLISNKKEEAYQPRVVSFGPYHHGKSHLASMEAQKQHTLQRFIDRLGRSKQDLFRTVREVAEELKDSYDSLDPKWKGDTEKFVQLMVLDGCFMLEVLQSTEYFNYDPVFSEHGAVYVLPFIRRDMLLLENQLPMLLLYRLNHIKDDEPSIEALNNNILTVFLNDNDNDNCKYPRKGRYLHVLDLFRNALLDPHNELEDVALQSPNQELEDEAQSPNQELEDVAPQSPNQEERKNSPPRYSSSSRMTNILMSFEHVKSSLFTLHKNQRPNLGITSLGVVKDTSSKGLTWPSILGNKKSGHNVVRPATELHNVGVHFERSESKSLLNITFDNSNGVLKLPNFVVDGYTESMFLNLLAFESCHIPAISDITSFIAFMDCIIDGSGDIELLSSKGIIDKCIGTDKEASDLFNTMSKNLIIWNDNLYKVYTNLVAYNNKPRNKWRANLIRTYSKSPGAITISAFAFLILFFLTLVQTIFTIIK